jgi:hypothetical protein
MTGDEGLKKAIGVLKGVVINGAGRPSLLGRETKC